MKKYKFIGSRVVKTGVAVLVTSFICQWMGWPAVFAVITAIVTIEPTVSDSIKKGIIRLPASAIGSAYAVFFISVFGNSPITYTAAAVFTIITCYKLKLHSGLLVATLTSVAMIEVIHGNFLIAFFIRLGTTSIGLLVSTAVNMFILPPNYSNSILMNIHSLLKATGEELLDVSTKMVHEASTYTNEATLQKSFSQVKRNLDKTDVLIQFQNEEGKYHRLNEKEKKLFEEEKEKISALRLIHYHIGNLINTPLVDLSWTKEESANILATVEALAESMIYPDRYNKIKHQEEIHKLMEHFWISKRNATNEKENENPTFFTAEIIILYELLSIYKLVEKLLGESNTFKK
ncbi:aromatic acid exporter family protein [Aquibacillus halophilus]|uniref:Aromatic acid exporter family protein n=1 Tax=Aquibacillus halophilus TaxID=930132 RepID=A0A6A8DDV0_9BACI|nr:aromatic acid exporter family protein [Aquibacillus halophilus]MRH41951.1 aromatic acid exporter family protein [Aquibacillus halophilus]